MDGFVADDDDDEKPDPNQQMRLLIVHQRLESQSHLLTKQHKKRATAHCVHYVCNDVNVLSDVCLCVGFRFTGFIYLLFPTIYSTYVRLVRSGIDATDWTVNSGVHQVVVISLVQVVRPHICNALIFFLLLYMRRERFFVRAHNMVLSARIMHKGVCVRVCFAMLLIEKLTSIMYGALDGSSRPDWIALSVQREELNWAQVIDTSGCERGGNTHAWILIS